MRKLITRSVLATVVVLALASSASAALIPIGQLEYLDSYFNIINQTGLDSTDDFPVETLLTFDPVHLDLNGGFQLFLADFNAQLNVLQSNAQFFIASGTPIPMMLDGSVNTGLVTLSSGTNALWNGQWNITTGALVDAAGNTPIVLMLDSNSFWETTLIYVEATPVPEPLTVGLLATGLAGLVVRRRKAVRR